MSKPKINSRALRQLAEELFERIAGEDEIQEIERGDFVTSLVRQWITYNGRATFFLGDRQVYLDLGRTPLGRPVVVPEPGLRGWTTDLIDEWKIDPEDLPEIFDHLNVGQSAEVVNGDGIPLRLWVNPQQRGWGVEPLVKEEIIPVARDYLKIALRSVVQQLGEELDPMEIDELARSIVSQWQRFEGNASLFLNSHTEFLFKITEFEAGGCEVTTSEISINLDSVLSSQGFIPEVFPEVIARINLGQQIEFRNREGILTRLWHDPKARRICHKPIEPLPPTS